MNTVALTLVTRLIPKDRVHSDANPVRRLYDSLGEADAERTICRALDDLARRITRIAELHFDCRHGEVEVECRRMAAVADQIGLNEVAKAADHLTCAIDSGCGHAIAAVFARLSRVTEQAIGEVWSIRHSKPQ